MNFFVIKKYALLSFNLPDTYCRNNKNNEKQQKRTTHSPI